MAKAQNWTVLRTWLFDRQEDNSIERIKTDLDEMNEALGFPIGISSNSSVVLITSNEGRGYMSVQVYGGSEGGNRTIEMKVVGKGAQVRAEDLASLASRTAGAFSNFGNAITLGKRYGGSAGAVGAATSQLMIGSVKMVAKGIRALMRDQEAYDKEMEFYNYAMGVGDMTFGGTDSQKLLKTIEEQAETGNVTAQYLLASAYLMGHGTEADTSKAMPWFEKAAEQGHEYSKVAVINEYLYSEGNNYDVEKKQIALRYLEEKAGSGDEVAMESVLAVYGAGAIEGIEKDIDKEIMLAEEYARMGCKEAKATLFIAYDSTCGGDEYSKFNNDSKAAEIYKELLEEGAGEWTDKAARNLAYMYEDGRGVEADPELAMKYYQIAADAGNIDSKVILAMKKSIGNLDERDIDVATKLCDELLKNEDEHVVSIATFCKYRIADEKGKYRESMDYANKYLVGGFTEDDKRIEIEHYLAEKEAKLATMTEDEKYEFFGEKKPFKLSNLFKKKK